MEHNSVPSSPEQQDDSMLWPADFHSYTLLSKIGQGSFASVWLCSVKDRQCAVKVLDLDHVNTNFIGKSKYFRLLSLHFFLIINPQIPPSITFSISYLFTVENGYRYSTRSSNNEIIFTSKYIAMLRILHSGH